MAWKIVNRTEDSNRKSQEYQSGEYRIETTLSNGNRTGVAAWNLTATLLRGDEIIQHIRQPWVGTLADAKCARTGAVDTLKRKAARHAAG